MKSLFNESHILTVSELTDLISGIIEREFGFLWVEGEISNLRTPSSGHSYFTLKDDTSQIRAVLFKGQGRRLPFTLEDGQRLICFGRLSVYKQRGEYQLIVEQVETAGLGSLHLAFEQLKTRLENEGLFEETRKKPLPSYPKRIGVVTSPTGDAIRDILKVLKTRGAGMEVIIAPARVQGEDSPGEIASAIKLLEKDEAVEVIIAGRGGGSTEDLMAFNSETVARAISESKVPIVSAVGHERDFTIADFVADMRAPTPSAAAEIITRSNLEIHRGVESLRVRLNAAITSRLDTLAERLQAGAKGLKDPGRGIGELRMRLDDLLWRLEREISGHTFRRRSDVGNSAARLDALSPLSVLGRGYAMATTIPEGKIITESAKVNPGDEINVRLKKGGLRCRVEKIGNPFPVRSSTENR